MEDLLNSDQKRGLEILKQGYNTFVSGFSGSGKSFLLKTFINYCNTNNIICGVTSTTGVSATLIGGYTIHSYTGILLGMEDKIALVERVQRNQKALKRWLYTRVLIIDEISMLGAELLEKLDYIGRKIRKNNKPFGGIQMVLVGYFMQLKSICSNYCFKSSLWDLLIEKNVYLNENMRQTDPVFQEILKEVRYGETSQKSIEMLESRIGAYIETAEGIIPTKLYSHKADVMKINNDALMALVNDKNPLRTYNAKDNAKRKDGMTITGEYRDKYLAHIDRIFQANKKLDLCIGAQSMLIFNIDVKAGLANGSRCVVIGFKNELPVVRFMNGLEIVIDYVSWSMKVGDDIIVSRRQIPLIVAYCVTIHKSQGSTLDCAQIDLGATIFEAGMAYTALSRVKCLEGLSIVTFDPSKLVANPDVIEFYKNLKQDNSKDKLDNKQPDDPIVNENRNELCCICFDAKINSVLLTCGHAVTCLNCSYNINKCPICRSEITLRNKIFL